MTNTSLVDADLCVAEIRNLVADRRFEAAELIAHLAIGIYPNNLGIAVERAWLAHHRGDFAEARRRWRQVLVAFPGRWSGLVGAWRSFKAAGPDPLYQTAFALGASGRSAAAAQLDDYDRLCWAMGWTDGAIQSAFGPAPPDSSVESSHIQPEIVHHLPSFSFQGHWPAIPLSHACKAALIAALSAPDAADRPFLGIAGLSGSAFRVFLNRLLRGITTGRYVELGVGAGSTMVAALHRNDISAVGVDDFSESVATKLELQANLSKVDADRGSFILVERSFDQRMWEEQRSFDVLFYDGPVAAADVAQAISAGLVAMKSPAIYIFDDWNSPEIREGYRRLLAEGHVRQVAAIGIRTTLDDSHPSFYGASSGWHNGYKIALLEYQAVASTPIGMSEAAAAISPIETAVPFAGDGKIALGDGFPNAAFFGPCRTTTSMNAYIVNDAVCSFATMLIYKDGRPIRETAYLVSDRELSYPAPTIADTEFQDFPETVIQPLCRAWQNYYHWLVQCLPAMLAGSKSGGRLLALPVLASNQEETLHLLGLQDYPRFNIIPGRSYRFRTVEVTDFIYGRSSFQISRTLRDVYRTMKDRARTDSAGAPKLYLTRRNAGHRFVRNESELSELLERRGFRTIDPGSHTVNQQISLFRNARTVVAPHGAAMTNIGFCEPGTQIYELMPEDYANACFNRIAQLMNLDYAADAFPNDASGDLFTRSFAVDLKRVASRLDSLGL